MKDKAIFDQVVDANLPEAKAHHLSAWQADPAWFAPLIRYFELTDNPMGAQDLGPSILREIHYRLLLSPIGRMLRRLLIADGHASRIAKAILVLR